MKIFMFSPAIISFAFFRFNGRYHGLLIINFQTSYSFFQKSTFKCKSLPYGMVFTLRRSSTLGWGAICRAARWGRIDNDYFCRVCQLTLFDFIVFLRIRFKFFHFFRIIGFFLNRSDLIFLSCIFHVLGRSTVGRRFSRYVFLNFTQN